MINNKGRIMESKEANKSKKLIVHIIPRTIFLIYFIDLLDDLSDKYRHVFFVYGKYLQMDKNVYDMYECSDNYEFYDLGGVKSSIINIISILSTKIKYILHNADLIVAHSLSAEAIQYLLFNQDILKKTVWIGWGEAFVYHQNTTGNLLNPITYLWKLMYLFQKIIAKNINYVATSLPEYKYILEHYNPQISRLRLDSPYYINNLSSIRYDNTQERTTKIIVGHSGWKEGNHIEILNILKRYKDNDILLYLPLSYGEVNYIKLVEKMALTIFGNKAIIISNFLPPNEYSRLLADMDIGIYNAKNQTGFGNITALLGNGTKVYLNEDGYNWLVFSDLGYTVYPVQNLKTESFTEFKSIDPQLAYANHRTSKTILSRENVVKQWCDVFSVMD